MNERCWILYGYEIKGHYYCYMSYQGEGSITSVDFDWEKACNKKVLGFYHTHPGKLSTPSNRDDRTMSALVRAEGRPLLCGILTEKTNNCYLYFRSDSGKIERKLIKTPKLIKNTLMFN